MPPQKGLSPYHILGLAPRVATYVEVGNLSGVPEKYWGLPGYEETSRDVGLATLRKAAACLSKAGKTSTR
jgi:hypothetical protein